MLSLSLYNGHNAGICIRKDEEIILNWELERFSRIKHDFGFNQDFFNKSLSLVNITMDDIDVIVTNKQDYSRKPPWEVPSTSEELFIKFSIKNKVAFAINHHLAHCSSTYYTSPFQEAAIITQDGGGDNENFSYGYGKDSKIIKIAKGKVKNIASYWSGITLNNYRMKRLHAWDPGSGAGKIMALAAYGNSNAQLEALLDRTMSEGIKEKYTDKDSKAFNDDEDLSDVSSQRSKDVAAALQQITEKEIESIYEMVYEKISSRNLCIAGGIALNCVANTRVNSQFTNLHVPPFPNDTGLAAGMSLFHWHHILGNPKNSSYFSPYLGPTYSEKEVLNALGKYNYSFKPLAIDEMVDCICNGEIICLAKGRSESGPRALGHRSIICLPSIKDGRDILNFNIKQREWYRPYAPIILDKYVDLILQDYLAESPYMSTSGVIRANWRSRLAAVNHIDNSTRPQIIHEEHEPFLYKLIEKVYKQTGIPVILNTSFNKQEPIVETPEQSLETFAKFKEIKYLVLHDYMVYKSE